MTTTLEHRPTSHRSIVPLVAAAALVVTVVGLVLVFGIVRPPALATVADDPGATPPAGVAWTSWRSGETCVTVVRPDGQVEREFHCERDGGDLVAWTDEGLVLRTWRGQGSDLVVIDPDTGEVVDVVTEASERPGPRPESVTTTYRDGRLTVARERDRDVIVWEVEAPDVYEISSSALSPDGGWFALIDSADRLLVVPADGSAEPRVWAEDAPRWQEVVWEGTAIDLEAPEPEGSEG